MNKNIMKPKVIALIPARGGSKSIPKKNLSKLHGKPLLYWSIEIALETKLIDDVYVSTDDKEIKKIAKKFGAKIHDRRKSLSNDKSLVVDLIKDFSKNYLTNKSDIIILLEPTSPFRTKKVVRNCIIKMIKNNLDSIATFEDAHINPNRTWKIKNNFPKPYIRKSIPWLPRQKLEKAYQLNGVVYGMRGLKIRKNQVGLLFGKKNSLIVPRIGVNDIDNINDLNFANAFTKTTKSKPIS